MKLSSYFITRKCSPTFYAYNGICFIYNNFHLKYQLSNYNFWTKTEKVKKLRNNKMSASVTKSQVLVLYKSLLKESQKFPNYNFRSYALRRIRDAFKSNKTISDNKQILKEYEYGKQNLEIIKRQVVIGDMFRTEKLVIENIQ